MRFVLFKYNGLPTFGKIIEQSGDSYIIETIDPSFSNRRSTVNKYDIIHEFDENETRDILTARQNYVDNVLKPKSRHKKISKPKIKKCSCKKK